MSQGESRSHDGHDRPLARLTEVSRALTYAVSIEQILDITVECASDLLAARRVVLMLREDDGLLRIRACRGIDDSVASEFREPLDETLVTRLSAVLGPDAAEGFLGVPLVVRGRVTGLLAVLRPQHGPPTDRDEWLLSALADQAGVALDHARSESTRTELEEKVDRLRLEGEHREDALRMVGHDLRSPLNAIQGYVHLLASAAYGPVNEDQEAALERVASIGHHIETMVANVLEMGRLAAGTLTLESEPVAVREVAEAARTIVELDAAERHVVVETDVPGDLRASASPDRLRQVLVQLLDNAVKFSPEGGAVTVTAASGPDGAVRLRVVDRGPGVPADQAESIFEPYRRLSPGADDSGFGLGLSIARALVELMGGTLELDPDVAEGSTFVITLDAA